MNSSLNQQHIELGHLRDGYPALASWVVRDPDNETFILRKFGRSAARNLLHLQARIIALEREIDDLDDEARRSTDKEARKSSRRYESLMVHAQNKNRPERKRVEKLNELDLALKGYYKALILYSQVSRVSKPSRRSLDTFKEYLKGTALQDENNKPVPLISGRAKAFLDDDSDLVSLAKPIEEDYLSRFLQHYWLFRKRKTQDPFDSTTIHKNSHIVRTVAALDLALASILLIGAIVNLYLVNDSKTTLGLVAMYTILFASSVALCTNARRVDVFTTTAAYAAVLVVFVSGNLGGSKSEQCLIELEGSIWKTVKCP